MFGPKGHAYKSVETRILAVAALALMCRTLSAGDQAHARRAWHFRPTGAKPMNELARLQASSDLKAWRVVSLPHSFDHIQRANNVYGWYVRPLRVPAAYRGHDLLLDLGTIDDADKTYLNGQPVGEMGSFDVQTQSAWNRDRRYIAPARFVRYDRINMVAVQVKDFTGLGGLMGISKRNWSLGPCRHRHSRPLR